MTIDQRIEALLPKKRSENAQAYEFHHFFLGAKSYNNAIDQCATNLKQAFERGEICFVDHKGTNKK